MKYFEKSFNFPEISKLNTKFVRPKKKKLFVSCNGPTKNRVGRSAKTFFFAFLFWSKMCVLCMFYVDWELGGRKNFRVGIFLDKNLLGLGYRKQITFYFRPKIFQGEILIRTLPTSLFQIFCIIIFNSQVIVKNVIDPDDNFQMIS